MGKRDAALDELPSPGSGPEFVEGGRVGERRKDQPASSGPAREPRNERKVAVIPACSVQRSKLLPKFKSAKSEAGQSQLILGQGFQPARHLCTCVIQQQLVQIGLSGIPLGIRQLRPGITSDRLRFHGSQFCQFPDVIVEMKPLTHSYK